MFKDFENKLEELKARAEEAGVGGNIIFVERLEVYKNQVRQLNLLAEEVKKGGVVCEKTYIKGQPNLQSSPALKEYTRIADSSNKTVATLIRLIDSLKLHDGDHDELLEIMNS